MFLGDNIEFETPPKIAVNPDEAEPENLLKLQRKRNFTPPLRIILDPPLESFYPPPERILGPPLKSFQTPV